MADVSAWVALAAGAAAFFAPCILPIVPAFLGFIAGGAGHGDDTVPTTRIQRLFRTLAFVTGFGIAFTVLGFLIASLGQSASFFVAQVWLRRIGGAFIIVFGLAMTGLLRFKWMDRDFRYHGKLPAWLGPTGSALVLGTAFGVGWSPCVGPILATILIQAGIMGGGAQGAFLLGLFSIGLAIPFIIFGLVADRGAGLLRKYGRVTHYIEVGGGIVIIVLGIFIYTGAANRLLLYLFPGSF